MDFLFLLKLCALLFINIKQCVLGVSAFSNESPLAARIHKIRACLFEYFTVRKYSPVNNNHDQHQRLHRCL